MRNVRFLLSILLLVPFLPAVQAQTASSYRHILWYYLNQPSTDNQRDWYEQADGSWVEQYVNGATSNFSVIAQNVSLPIYNGSQQVTVTGRVIEKSDQSLIAFIPDEMTAGMWLQWKAPGSFDGQWNYLAPITSVDGTIAAVSTGAAPVQTADNQMPAQPAADSNATTDTAGADALQDKKDDLQSQIDDANSDIQLKQEDIEDSQNSIQRFQNDPTCTGIPGIICQAGIAKFRNEINSDNQAISSDQQKISSLQNKLAALGGSSTANDGSDGDGSGSSGGGSYSGANAEWVQKMLARAQPGWSCPATASSPVMSKPIVASDLPCMRDKYVAAAVVAAWAAECHARLGMNSDAEQNAQTMMQSLDSARSLCSNAPAVAGGESCTTLNVFSCSE